MNEFVEKIRDFVKSLQKGKAKKSESISSATEAPNSENTTKEVKRKANSQDLSNPYLRYKEHFISKYDNIVTTNTYLLVVTIISLILCLGSLASAIIAANQSKIQPYVITVDNHGLAVGQGLATPIQDTEPRIVISTLSKFIQNVRNVTVDGGLMTNNFESAYTYLDSGDPAITKINKYLSGQDDVADPYTRAKEVLVSTDVVSAISITEETYQIDWVETTTTRTGKLLDEKNMRALVTYYKGKEKTNPREIILNPLGIYVKDISWQVLK